MIDERFKEIIQAKTGCAVIIAGSDSDKPHIEEIVKYLTKYTIPHMVRICSAHKEPTRTVEIIKEYEALNGALAYVLVAGGVDALSGTGGFHAFNPVYSCPPDTKPRIFLPQQPMKPDLELKIKAPRIHNLSCLNNPPTSSNAYIADPRNLARHIAQVYSAFNSRFRDILRQEKESKIGSLGRADEEFSRCYLYLGPEGNQ